MILKLEEVTPGKTLTRDLDYSRETIQAMMGDIDLEGIRAHLQFRTDPLGHTVHYRIHAQAKPACIRCGQPVDLDVSANDWLSLRTQHPNEDHVVLDASEMNVRFLEQPVLDLREFILETIELALPDYPRHEDGHPGCASDEDAGSEDKASPFEALSKYLEPKDGQSTVND